MRGWTIRVGNRRLEKDGVEVTASPAELNRTSGLTAAAAELNALAGVTAGVAAASKALVLDAGKDLGDIRDLAVRQLAGPGGTQQPLVKLPAPDAVTTVGAATYTIANLLKGILLRDPNGANRADTLPTAALVVAGIASAEVGDVVECTICNTADAAETITLAAGAGGTVGNTRVTTAFGQHTSLTLQLRLTNVTPSSEAYTVYA